jgi:hypothetical protein
MFQILDLIDQTAWLKNRKNIFHFSIELTQIYLYLEENLSIHVRSIDL